MRIVNLASGSKGNSTFVCYGNTKILIDEGLSVRELGKRLDEIGEKIENINAVLVTHEHSDHIAGIKTLAKNFDMDFYFHQKVVSSGVLGDIPFGRSKLKTFESAPFAVGEINILPVPVSHDSVFPVGFVANAVGSKSKVAFLTDLGEVDESVFEQVKGVKMIFLESNHDNEMLLSGSYPPALKRRILSKTGHLSNAQSLEFAQKLAGSGTKCFVLSHLSQDNNTPELAYTNFLRHFENEGKDIIIRVSSQNKHGDNFNLKEEF